MEKCIFAFFICLFIAGCIPNTKSEAPGFVKVVIADRTFKIPKGYFDGKKATGKDTESVVLEYSLPGFEVLPPHPKEREARQKLIKEGLVKGMLLEAARNRPSLDKMIGNRRNGSDRIGPLEKNEYGLEKYSVSDWEGRMAVRPDDTYIEREATGNVKSFLHCSPPGKDKIPGCRHTFIDKGILYRIRWPLHELPNWQEQRDTAISFIDSMEIK